MLSLKWKINKENELKKKPNKRTREGKFCGNSHYNCFKLKTHSHTHNKKRKENEKTKKYKKKII